MTDQRCASGRCRILLNAGVIFAVLWGAVHGAMGAAGLTDALVLWNMETTDDANGENSTLTLVDLNGFGIIDVNNFDALFWGDEGAGADGFYANCRSPFAFRAGLYMDAGQGASDELQITGAHTVLMRCEVKDASVTGYFWNKYDHNVGPNSQKNRGGYLRYEPGGSVLYAVDDGDGGQPGATVSFPAGTVLTIGSGGQKYEIISVFDPDNSTAAVHILNPKTRAVLNTAENTNVLFNTVDMATPVPFTIGDRLTWNGANWQSIGGSGANLQIEMVAVWDRAYSLQDLVDLAVDAPVEPVDHTEVTVDPAIHLRFDSEVGEEYRLEVAPGPLDTNWVWTGVTIRGDGNERQAVDDPGTDGQKTYRIATQ